MITNRKRKKMGIVIKNVHHNNDITDILILGNQIAKISPDITTKNHKIIDGENKMVLPAFYNTHTHAAMSLMRGYSDDLPVLKWLQEKIWPLEAKLTAEDVYIGTKLAALEMIKSGTVFFNDMYWHCDKVAQAIEEMGLRAAINAVVIDFNDPQKFDSQKKTIKREFEKSKDYTSRIQFVIGTHSIYTVSEYALKWCADFARKHNTLLHIHLSETEQEVEDCIKLHRMRPVEYLEKINFLGPNVIAAHAIWLNDEEIDILKAHEVTLSHVPTSNMKLSSGIFPYKKFTDYTNNLTLGTDGCASNNNLDMGEEMKIASIKAKLGGDNPTLMPADDALAIATKNGARAFNINAGEIEKGYLADLVLIDLIHPSMIPNHNTISNYVYSANGSVIDTTICNGKILMENRHISEEEKILFEASKCAKDLVSK